MGREKIGLKTPRNSCGLGFSQSIEFFRNQFQTTVNFIYDDCGIHCNRQYFRPKRR